MKKNIIIAIAFSFVALGCITIPQTTNAASISVKHRIPTTTSATQKVDISYLRKHTSFSQEMIACLYAEGYNKEDIKNLYVLKNMSKEKFKDLTHVYKNSKKNISLVLKEYEIDKNDFEKEFKRVFPEGEDTNFDRAKRIKNLRHAGF